MFGRKKRIERIEKRLQQFECNHNYGPLTIDKNIHTGNISIYSRCSLCGKGFVEEILPSVTGDKSYNFFWNQFLGEKK